MHRLKMFYLSLVIGLTMVINGPELTAQDLPTRYPTLELFTNTPCPICGSQNPGLFDRLANYEGEYHLISFYPGKPYSSCIYYQANIPENNARFQHYTGKIFGTPTVALNGIDFKSSSGVTNTVLDNLTGGTSWLHVDVEETDGSNRNLTIQLDDVVGGSLNTGRLFAAIVEKEISYVAPNGETLHHNVFRRFLTTTEGEEVDLSSGSASRTYTYDVDNDWDASQTYVIAWLSDPGTKEIINSGTRFDPDFTSAVDPVHEITKLAVYPNPASTEVNVSMPPDVTSADISVFDQQGSLVHSLRFQQEALIKINVADFPTGKYFISLQTDKQLYTGAFEVVR